MISLLPSGVPNVELDLAAGADLDGLAQTTRVYRTDLLVVEVSLAETESQGGFTHTSYHK